ncbi:rCG32592, isoform CRA_d [Rattus norvegicus]|uniref:RCG32592, isoform CRA_d n=1 Tax=Rattus norvegicus TaxID=10116 RepID=A6HFW6_RAT|nr:rCG32592, isoform CRA_d [Rattus norvegicus]
MIWTSRQEMQRPLPQLWLGPWLDSYPIYLTFYFGFPHPFKLSGRPCPSPSSLGQA